MTRFRSVRGRTSLNAAGRAKLALCRNACEIRSNLKEFRRDTLRVSKIWKIENEKIIRKKLNKKHQGLDNQGVFKEWLCK